ncbi:MAG: hypothetical protein WAV09_03215 [Minisyncoccia bacterium]
MEIEHVFISDKPVRHGQMTPSDKYAPFTALCVFEIVRELSAYPMPSYTVRRTRERMALREHWHHKGTKPTCARCALLQALLKANVPKAQRMAFTTPEMRELMARITAVNEKMEELDKRWMGAEQ